MVLSSERFGTHPPRDRNNPGLSGHCERHRHADRALSIAPSDFTHLSLYTLLMATDIQTDPVILSYKSALESTLGARLKELWLFGSRARGDFHENSDYDMIVVAEGSMKELRATVSDAGYAILDRYEELIGNVVYTPELWERSKHGPLGMNVLAHGIRIA